MKALPRPARVLAVAAAAACAVPAAAQLIVPLSQERGVHSFVIVPPCTPETDSQQQSAAGFGPLQATVVAERACKPARARAVTSQSSEIGPASIIASGAAVLQHVVEPLPDGEPNSLQVDDSGVLEPGSYTLAIGAVSGIDSTVPPGGDGHASFTLQLLLGPPCRADFNNDGILDSQDFFDFLTCFLAPGACPPEAADFNADGFVNTQDFFDFLAAFFAGCP
jgi:hypothetical protein